MLPIFNHALQNKARKEKSETGNADEQEKIIQPRKQDNAGKTQPGHQKARSKVVVNIDGIAESGLNEPGTRAGHIRGGKRDGLADRIQRLLNALAHGWLVLRRLLLSSQCAQASPQH
jgi:hypothetical protein